MTKKQKTKTPKNQAIQNKDLSPIYIPCYILWKLLLSVSQVGGFYLHVKGCQRKKIFPLGKWPSLSCVCDRESQIPSLSNQDSIQWCTQVNKPKYTSPKIAACRIPYSSVWGQEGWPGLHAGWGARAGLACLLRKQGKYRRPCLSSDSSHCSLSQETSDNLRCSSPLLSAKHIHLAILSGDFSFYFPLKKNKQRKQM